MKIALVTDFFMTGGGLEHIYQIASNMPDIEFGVFGKDGHGKDKFHKLSNVKIFSNGYSKNIVKTFGLGVAVAACVRLVVGAAFH